MLPRVWQFEARTARLELATLAASVDLDAPGRGLTNIRFNGQGLPGHELLGVGIDSLAPTDADTLLDWYQRGGDLVATYAQTASRPVRVQVYWRGAQTFVGTVPAPAVDLQVSVQTGLWDSKPALMTRSVLPRCEVWRLSQGPSARFERLELPGGQPLAITPRAGPGCLAFRLAATGVTYVEMVHPADFLRDELTLAAGGVRLQHRLFADELEKGVILRARVRGMLVPREEDAVLAASAYAAFTAAAPPLTT